MKFNIKIKTLDKEFFPTKANPNDSGYDLKAYITEPINILPGERTLINTGIIIELPNNIEAQIRPRSGLAINKGLTVLNTPGTIDSEYRGEIKVILINLGHNEIIINRLDRIAQLIFQEKTYTELINAEEISENTKRGTFGFGSSGL